MTMTYPPPGGATAGRPPRFTTLHWALLLSLGVHLVLVTLRFVDPQAFNKVFEDTPLEVVLVNAQSREDPTKAQAVAQRKLAGGGEAAQGRATSPMAPSALTEMGDSAEEQRRQIQKLMEQQNQMLAQIRRELATLPPPDPSRDLSDPKAAAEEERRRQLLQMLAEIERRINEENARPKRRYVSPSTREAVYAVYYDQLRRKIEMRGTENFPEVNGRKLYGELTMIVTVDARGRVIASEVVQSSGSRQLDRRAEAIVRASAPFGNFSREMRSQADEIVVVSRFKFRRDDALETTLSNRQ